MKRRISFFLVFFLIAGLNLFPQAKAPMIAFESQTKDFGKVFEGETLKHVFKFTNKGTATLEISKVEPG